MFSYVFKLSSVESIVKVECFDMLPDIWNVKYQVVKYPGLSWNPRNPMESTRITYPHHCHITVCHAAAEVRGLVSCAQ